MGKHLYFLFQLIASIYIAETAVLITHLYAVMCSTVIYTAIFTLSLHSQMIF